MLLIVGVALMGGPLAYIVVPQPVAAEPGAVHALAVRAPAAASVPIIAPPPAFIGGAIEPGDLLSSPVGIVSTGTGLAAGGELIGWPVSDHTPSTGFGYRSDPFTHRQRWHDGVDLGEPCGSPAVASLDGTVAYAGWAGGYGNRVILRHADRDGLSFATTYNHLAEIEVTVGQQVTKSAVVGRIGSTGRSTACHMHFEVILDGSYVDPMRFLTGDTSKAGLSRRVGSFMPSGLPSPSVNTLSTPSPSRTRSASPTPSATTPTPSATTPGATTATPTTPSPTTPGATIPSPTTPSPTPSATTPTPGPSTPTGSATPALSPASASTHPATAGSSSGDTPAAPTSPQAASSTTSNAVATPS